MIRDYFRVLIRDFLRYVGFLAFGLRFVWEWIVVVGLYIRLGRLSGFRASLVC